jgi:hypothetical protein
MAYGTSDPRIGSQAIATTDTVQNHPLGTIIRANDPTYGDGEFIYLLGVASTTVGSVVTYDASTYQTVLSAVGGNIPRAVAIAMSANVASAYGWYQISGQAVVAKTATVSLAAGAAVGVLTIGLIAGTGTGKEINGAVVAAVASNTTGRVTVKVMIARPTKQGRIT